jgi:NAD(P)-dependent dehydrogenase (short-subunit alcohol dehydrogenase family)
MKWHETHALVTGGSRGIGLQLVKQLLDKGAQVTATGTTDGR